MTIDGSSITPGYNVTVQSWASVDIVQLVWPAKLWKSSTTIQWRHNGRGSVSNHQPHDCLLNHLFGRRSKKTLKLRVIGLCAGNPSVTGEFPAQMASNAENVSIWWRHHVTKPINVLQYNRGGAFSIWTLSFGACVLPYHHCQKFSRIQTKILHHHNRNYNHAKL